MVEYYCFKPSGLFSKCIRSVLFLEKHMDRNLISLNYLCICNISTHHHKQVGTPFVILSQSGVSI